jgi:hypothetical protein
MLAFKLADRALDRPSRLELFAQSATSCHAAARRQTRLAATNIPLFGTSRIRMLGHCLGW